MMLSWVGVALTLSTAAAPQDPPEPDLEKLQLELREKFDASGPFTANLTFESIDSKGAGTVRIKQSLYVRMKEAWIFSEARQMGKEGSPGCHVLDGNRYVLMWTKGGGGGVRVDVRPTFRALWNHQWQIDRERRKVLEVADPPKDFDAYVAGLHPFLSLQLEPAPPGAADPALFRFVLGTSSRGGASWLSLGGKRKVVASADEVTVRESAPARTTVIDRRTGFLRSIRLDLPSGESKMVKVADVVAKAPHPDVGLPEVWKERPAGTAEALNMVSSILRAKANSDVGEILEHWARAGSDDRAAALRDYFAWIAAEFDASNRTNSRLGFAARFVREWVGRGASLEELSRDIDAQAKVFADKARAAEAGSKQTASLAEGLAGLRQDLEKAASEAPGPEEAKTLLVRRIREGFEPERIRKAVPSLSVPDYLPLLREAIDAAREMAAK